MLSDGTTISNLPVAELVDREQRLVLPRDQHVADARARRRWWSSRARRNRAPARSCRAAVTKALRLRGVAAGLLERVGPGRQVVPARAARGLRIRRDHGDAGPDQIVPVLGCASGCPRAPGRRSSRCRACCSRARRDCQLAGIKLGLVRDGVDVVGQRQRHDVGLQPVDDGARLFARAAVGLLDVTVWPVLAFQYLAKTAL